MDEETLLAAALELRERYPDDEDFADAMERLSETLAEDGGESAPAPSEKT